MTNRPSLDDLPLRRRPARQIALRRAAAGGSGAAEHQREPAPAQQGARRRRRAHRCAMRPSTCTAIPTATRWPCAPTWPPTSACRPASSSEWKTSGRQMVPTRSCSSCCRPSADRGAARSASSRRIRCTRSSPTAPTPNGSRRFAPRTSASTSTPRSPRSPTVGLTWCSSPAPTTRRGRVFRCPICAGCWMRRPGS